MICPQCGLEQEENSTFCAQCGAKVEAAPAAPLDAAAVVAAAMEAEIDAAVTAEASPEAPAASEAPAEKEQPAVRAYRDPFGEPGGKAATVMATAAPAEAAEKANEQSNQQVPPPPVLITHYRSPYAPQQSELDDLRGEPVGVGEWLGSLLLLALLPVAVSLIAGFLSDIEIVYNILGWVSALCPLLLIFYWAFGRKVKPSKRNFFRAALLYVIIIVAVTVVLYMFVLPQVLSAAEMQEILDLINSLF